MKDTTKALYKALITRHPELENLPLLEAAELLTQAMRAGHKLLLCGNGGSCADCDHIAGELLKGFLKKRPVPEAFSQQMEELYPGSGKRISRNLQVGLPVISLTAHAAAISAFANDVSSENVYAQQVLAYGNPGDVLIGISTSGNSGNVVNALKTANALGLTTIALTGNGGGQAAHISTLSLPSPETETYLVQESHLQIYHFLCAAVENELFDC
ncbi:MAG: SIS domain-containing protein [Clostridiales bacterium]|nr:SIS domain-containing protein [Clostridiales bacterium]